MSISREDYSEPCCPLNMKPEVRRIQVGRVIEKLDLFLARQDFAAAERHLKYWLAEAESGNDTQGRLSVLNEQIGLYRKLGKKDEGLAAVTSALALCDSGNFDGTVSLATTFVNAATAYKAFGMPDDALPLYRKAEAVYLELLPENDVKTGALYNNTGLCLCSLGQYAEALDAYMKAIKIMSAQERGEAETAITWLNIADLYAAQYGLEEGEEMINSCLDTAELLLDTEGLEKNAELAYIYEKCAPVFGYYGRFLTEEKYAKEAKRIYERY